MINLPYMGLITIRLMNAPTNHVPANPRHVHTPISDDEQPVLLVIYAGCMGESLWFTIQMWPYTLNVHVYVYFLGLCEKAQDFVCSMKCIGLSPIDQREVMSG